MDKLVKAAQLACWPPTYIRKKLSEGTLVSFSTIAEFLIAYFSIFFFWLAFAKAFDGWIDDLTGQSITQPDRPLLQEEIIGFFILFGLACGAAAIFLLPKSLFQSSQKSQAAVVVLAIATSNMFYGTLAVIVPRLLVATYIAIDDSPSVLVYNILVYASWLALLLNFCVIVLIIHRSFLSLPINFPNYISIIIAFILGILPMIWVLAQLDASPLH